MDVFTIRVYGLLVNDKKEILLSDEECNGISFTKFPGGGLQFGEGTIDCIKREFMEEANLKIEALSHFYTTDFFQPSAFNNEKQVMSIYYKVKCNNISEKFNQNQNPLFHWKKLKELSVNDVTFPIDKKVVAMIKEL